MTETMTTSALLKALGGAVAVIQLIDIVVHAATDQLETVRVTSNVVALAWLASLALGRFSARAARIAAGCAIGGYVALNAWFLVVNGVTNAGRGGEVRVALFGLVVLTVLSSVALTSLSTQRGPR